MLHTTESNLRDWHTVGWDFMGLWLPPYTSHRHKIWDPWLLHDHGKAPGGTWLC